MFIYHNKRNNYKRNLFHLHNRRDKELELELERLQEVEVQQQIYLILWQDLPNLLHNKGLFSSNNQQDLISLIKAYRFNITNLCKEFSSNNNSKLTKHNKIQFLS